MSHRREPPPPTQRSTNGRRSNDQDSSNLYQQLIDGNDLVRELDDIEAISQQISQHAEVLYQTWKNSAGNSPTTENGPVTPSAPRSLPIAVANSHNNGSLGKRVNNNPDLLLGNGSANARPAHLNLDSNSFGDPSRQRQTETPTLLQRRLQSNSTLSSPSSSYLSDSTNFPSSSKRTITQIGGLPSPAQQQQKPEPLELLASPEVNGNLKDLVSSFVSTDRAKQAARQTISDTISCMTRRNGGGGLGSPSLSSPFSSRLSPLKSPMLAASSVSSPSISGSGGGVHSSPSSISGSSSTSSMDSQNSLNPRRSPIQNMNSISILRGGGGGSGDGIHTKMTPMFGGGGSVGGNAPDDARSKEWTPLQITRDTGTIPIPVQHMGRSTSASASTSHEVGLIGRGGTSNQEVGLKSPGVLQTINPRRTSNRNSLEFDMPLPSLHAANVERMRQRFEEAKLRINLMHQRAMDVNMLGRSGPFGGSAMDERSMFPMMPNLMSDFDAMDSSGSNFMLEHMRRRSARRRDSPAAPHPELTPQQKQHIIERSVLPGTLNYSSQGFPMRRFLSGGSVAERVLIFERCPVFPTDHRDAISKPVQLQQQQAMLEQKVPDDVPIVRRSILEKAENEPKLALKTITPLAKSPSPAAWEVPISRARASMLDSSSSISPVTKSVPVPSLSSSPSLSATSLDKRQPIAAATAIGGRKAKVAAKERDIPKFHFPYGLPSQNRISADRAVQQLQIHFRTFKKAHISQEEVGQLLKACGYIPSWKGLVFSSAAGDKTYGVTIDQITTVWRQMLEQNADEASQFVYLLTRGARKYVVPEDLVQLIQDIVDCHPGLGFLKEATEFHSRYVHTVIARIFYCVNRSWSGRITIPELRKSNLLQVLRLLEEEEDINQITDYFSYEHFYVIYCKFWELDKDHDLFIDREDLSKHNDHAISTRMIDRIFSGAVTRGTAQKEGKMSYTEFVWFLIAEEDKRHPTAIEYWFRCMDLDGDGFLSMYELEYFYEEQLQRMEQLGIETLPFEDCLCQMFDMIMPKHENRISLQDLKRCSTTPIFFDTFFNLEKYLDHEQRDPFASQRDLDEDGNEMSDWDRFAAEEYELLVSEEGNPEGIDEYCEDDLLNPSIILDAADDPVKGTANDINSLESSVPS